jgi:hypothetical protein
MKKLLLSLVLATSALAARDARAGACIPGAQVACACVGGASGVQVCADDGSRLGACQCAAASPAPVAAPTQLPAPPTVAPAPAPWGVAATPTPPAATATGTPPPTPPTEAKRGRSLLIGGIVTLGVGYFFSIIVGVAGVAVAGAQQANSGVSCPTAPAFAFVPLFGAAVVAATYPHYAKMNEGQYLGCNKGAPGVTAFGVIDTLAQVGGAGMIGAGIGLGASSSGARAGQAAPARVLVTPGVAGNPAGLTAVIRWF